MWIIKLVGFPDTCIKLTPAHEKRYTGIRGINSCLMSLFVLSDAGIRVSTRGSYLVLIEVGAGATARFVFGLRIRSSIPSCAVTGLPHRLSCFGHLLVHFRAYIYAVQYTAIPYGDSLLCRLQASAHAIGPSKKW